jgi:hypothetical protein
MRPGDLVRREHEVDAAGRDGAPRHARMLRRLVLGERDATGGLDRFQPQGAVRCAPGEHHPDRLMRLLVRQRGEELVDGVRQAVTLARQEMQRPLRHFHGLARRNHVDVIRPYPRLVVDLQDWHRRDSGEDLREGARVRGREMLHDDVSQAGIRRKGLEKLPECLETAGRRADAHDREWGAWRGVVRGFAGR